VRVSQDTVRSEQRSWKTGPNLPHRLIAKGTKEAHRSPRCSAKRVHSLSSLCNVQGTCVSSRAPRPDPDVRLSRLRLVWGFLCQGASHIFVAVTSIFCSTRKHSSVSTADNHRRRATRVKDGASSASPNTSTAAGFRDRVVCRMMIRREPAIGHELSRANHGSSQWRSQPNGDYMCRSRSRLCHGL
jgi:hypothetical protein